ncbi:MAG: hypothetical protein Q8R47_00730 [Nanoarchaeota archaeon]|nr:hypothetical protein [Nanoarchaeota archaeon]
MNRLGKIFTLFLISMFLAPSAFAMFTQPDPTLPDLYDPQQLNRYAYARNSPYNYVDPDGKAAVWIHYTDTFKNYFLATGDPFLAANVAAGAIEPDLYRYSRSENPIVSSIFKGSASALGLDLQMDVMGSGAEGYYHEGKDYSQSSSVNLQSAFDQALSRGKLGTIGNLEHALGHDVGSSGVAGYHALEIQGGERSKLSHLTNDVFSTSTDRGALNKAQYERAQGARSLGLPSKTYSKVKETVKSATSTVKKWFSSK